MKKKPFQYPVPKFITGIKDRGIKLWEEIKSGNYPPEKKIRLACRLAGACLDSGDKGTGEALLFWARDQIPSISQEIPYTREFAAGELALGFWWHGLIKQAEKDIRNLPGFVKDIYYEAAFNHLLQKKEDSKGWQLACQCSQSFYQPLYLNSVMEGFERGQALPLDVPRLLSQVRLKPGEEAGYVVHTFCLAAQCWMKLGDPDKAVQFLKQAEAVQVKFDPKLLDRIEALERRLEITEGYFEAGQQQTALEKLRRCWMEHDLLVSVKDHLAGEHGGLESRLDGALASASGLEMQYGNESSSLEKAASALTSFGGDRVWFELGQAYLSQLRFKKALGMAGRIKDAYSRIKLYSEVAGKCRQEKMKTLGARVYQAARKTAQSKKQYGLWLLLAQTATELNDDREALQ
ncbi:MAG: hypothetical protein Q8O74_10025, partial [bacterium]|nr:hypothetical protein [bacterium]